MKINGKEVKLTRDKVTHASTGVHNGVAYRVFKVQERDPYTGKPTFIDWVFGIPGWGPGGSQRNVEGWSTKHDAVAQAIRYIEQRQRWALEDQRKQQNAAPAKGA